MASRFFVGCADSVASRFFAALSGLAVAPGAGEPGPDVPSADEAMKKRRRSTAALGAILLGSLSLAGCASLGALAQAVQAPRFRVAGEFEPQIRLLGPSLQRPLGGASVRLWAGVTNPNPIGLVLSSLQGDLSLEGVQAAEVSFPLGLPLAASQDTVIPLDIAIDFSRLPRLAELIPRALGQGSVAYRLDGTVGVDAGMLGQPTFGPMQLLQGSIRTGR
jgi:hypothetical protein